MKFAQRMSRLTTAASFDMLARGKALEAQGRSIVHLGIGEPDFDTPAHIRHAANAALEAGYTHYGPAPGLPEGDAPRTLELWIAPEACVPGRIGGSLGGWGSVASIM